MTVQPDLPMTGGAVMYDGAEETAKAWSAGLSPDPAMTVTEWADEHRYLASKGASEPGKYRTNRTPYLREIMDCLSPSHPAQKVVWSKSAQVGAPLALDTPVPTPFGWTTMGEIRVGDLVYDERGKMARVTGLSPVFEDRECFAVEFDDGEVVVSDGGHRWSVLDFTYCQPTHRTLTTAEMAPRVVLGSKGSRRRYAIDCCEPIDMPEQDLILHPYVLGIWLGNGSSIMNHISVHEDDAEIVEHLSECGVEAEFRLPHWRRGRVANVVIDPTFRMRREDGASLSHCFRSRFVTRLRQLDVLDNKHVPLPYLRASRAQRLDLVRGLMDSDGTITPDGKRCEFSNADRGLIDAMIELLRGLGYKPAVYHGKARRKVFGRDGRESDAAEFWRVSWSAYAEEPMFRLSRKRDRMRSIENGRPWKAKRRRIVAIRPVPSVPVRCIEVDSPSHLFLCGKGWIPTHNTEAGINWIGYVMDVSPAAFLAVQANEATAKKFSRQRIDGMIEATPRIRDRVAPAKSRDSGNTILEKGFPGGHLFIQGGNSAAGLRSMPIRFVHLDEVDAYESDLDDEGDPVALAEARTITFGRRKKIFISSTPTISGSSRIETEFELSDQRRYFVPCPHCHELQHLQFEQLKWDFGMPKTAAYVCEHCGTFIEERHKTWMLDPANGAEWRPTADPEVQRRAREANVVGFHISGLYSPIGWLSWEAIARKWEEAQGKAEALKTFKNTILGEAWIERGDAPDWQRLYDRREGWSIGTVPEGVLVLTMGVDVQRGSAGHGWLDCHVWGWGRNGESWLVDHEMLPGDVQDPATWAPLTEWAGRTYTASTGVEMSIARIGVDTGDGMTSDAVYAWCRQMGRGQVYALKGRNGSSASAGPVNGPSYVDVTENGKKIHRGQTLWNVDVSHFKLETFGNLRLSPPTDEDIAEGAGWPRGYVHVGQGTTAEWFKQMTGEHLGERKIKRTGYIRREWIKDRARNEALDCRVYARAMAWLMGVDRWVESKWQELEAQINPTQENPQPAGDPRRHVRRRGGASSQKPDWFGGGSGKGKWF